MNDHENDTEKKNDFRSKSEETMKEHPSLVEETKSELKHEAEKIESCAAHATGYVAGMRRKLFQGWCQSGSQGGNNCTYSGSGLYTDVQEGKICHCGCEAEHCLCREIFPWLGFVAIAFASGWVSSLFMQPQSFEWFASLTHPAWAPPQWIFLPVWLLLYFLLGTSVWISWRKLGCQKASGILVLFVLLLMLQIGWCYLFFYSQNPFGAFVDLIWVFAVLLLLELATIPVCRAAAGLLLPQIIWILYALVLNYNLWRLN